MVHEFMKQGMNAVIIRPTAIYGPGDPGRFLMIFRWAKKAISHVWQRNDVLPPCLH